MHATGDIPRTNSTTMILTEAGSSYFFERNQRLQRFRLADGREDFGLRLRDYDPHTLDKLISGGLIRKLEYPVQDVLHDRKALMSYVTTVTLGFFAYTATYRVQTMLTGSRLYRRTPHSKIAVLRTDDRERRELTKLLTRNIRSHVHANHERPPDDASTDILIARFLAAVPGEAWNLIIHKRSDPDTPRLLTALTELIGRLVTQAELADYLALVWVELVRYLQHPTSGDSVPEVHLLSQLNGAGLSAGAQSHPTHQLHMMAATGDIQYAALKADLDQIAPHIDGGTKTYEQFYRSADTDQENLGLYYLGFLQDSCRRVGVGLRAFARGGRSDGNLNLIIST